MGIDYLDIHFRLERALGVRLPPTSAYLSRQQRAAGFVPTGTHDVTAGEVHAHVCEALVEFGHAVPADSWAIVRTCIGDALGHPPEEVRPEHWLIRDLGAS